MSTRKKVGISDLLRDEAQKGVDSSFIEVTAETVSEPTHSINQSTSHTTSAIAESPKSPAIDGQIVDDISKAKISTLESTLAQSQQTETELLKTIADLQKDLQFSQTNVELLQKSLAAIESLKGELEQQLVEVKRDNLRLAEANIQLSTQLSDLSKSLESAKPSVEATNTSQLATQNQTSQNQTSQNPRATPRKQPVEQPYANRDRPAYTRPMGSNEQLQRVNNKNIGWMD